MLFRSVPQSVGSTTVLTFLSSTELDRLVPVVTVTEPRLDSLGTFTWALLNIARGISLAVLSSHCQMVADLRLGSTSVNFLGLGTDPSLVLHTLASDLW